MGVLGIVSYESNVSPHILLASYGHFWHRELQIGSVYSSPATGISGIATQELLVCCVSSASGSHPA